MVKRKKSRVRRTRSGYVGVLKDKIWVDTRLENHDQVFVTGNRERSSREGEAKIK